MDSGWKRMRRRRRRRRRRKRKRKKKPIRIKLEKHQQKIAKKTSRQRRTTTTTTRKKHQGTRLGMRLAIRTTTLLSHTHLSRSTFSTDTGVLLGLSSWIWAVRCACPVGGTLGRLGEARRPEYTRDDLKKHTHTNQTHTHIHVHHGNIKIKYSFSIILRNCLIYLP